MADGWTIYDTPLTSRLLLGTALYSSPKVMRGAIAASNAEIITVALRRQPVEVNQHLLTSGYPSSSLNKSKHIDVNSLQHL